MSEKLNQFVEKLLQVFNGERIEFASEPTVVLMPEQIQAAAKLIHDEFGFELLSCVTAVDYWPEENPRFHVFYRFTSITHGVTLNVRVKVSGVSPVVPSVAEIYHNANWHEREVFDMFGIKFEGHPDLRRILMPADWEGHPQRKDYPLGYEEPQYTFNFDEIAVRKPFAKE